MDLDVENTPNLLIGRDLMEIFNISLTAIPRDIPSALALFRVPVFVAEPVFVSVACGD
jgi:hypothetical protein